jgi:hypothetical protein
MPRVAMDFSKTVIYHFVCQDTNFKCSYVGSTTNFVKRKAHHKSACKIETDKNHNLKLYQTIRDNGGWTNWKMIPLEEFECENKTQQVIREQYWIDRLKPELNCLPAYQTEEQTKQKEKVTSQKYREAHKEETKERNKNYDYKAYFLTHKEQHKQSQQKYGKAHRQQISAYQREWRVKKKAEKSTLSPSSQSTHTDPSSTPVLDCPDRVEESH